MPVEIKGQQLRIRVRSPSNFTRFRTDDVGEKGRLQRVAGYKNGKWSTQSWRLNLEDYPSRLQADSAVNYLAGKGNITWKQADEAKRKIKIWFR